MSWVCSGHHIMHWLNLFRESSAGLEKHDTMRDILFPLQNHASDQAIHPGGLRTINVAMCLAANIDHTKTALDRTI